MFDKGEVTSQVVQDLALYASNSRRYVETEWFLNELFGEGIHSAYWNNERNLWDSLNENIRTIDMYNVVLNGLINSTVKNDPRPEVRLAYGAKEDEQTKHDLAVNNIFCATLYERENFKQSIRDAVRDGFSKNESWVAIEYNDSDNNGVGEINLKKENSWNMLRDPNGKIDAKTGEFDGDWLIRQVLVPIDSIKNNPEYLMPNRENVTEYAQRDPNDLKSQLLGIMNATQNINKGLALLQEMYYRKWVIEKRGEGDDAKEYQVQKYYKKVFSQDIELTEETEEPIAAYPFKCYQVIRKDGDFNIKPHMSRVIPLNKTLDMVLTKMEKQVRSMNVGRILMHESTKITTMTEEDGQMIRYGGSRPPEVMPQGGISADLFQFYGVLQNLIQDTGLFHLESSGGGGNQSGIAIAQKQAGDIFNVTEPAQNLSIFIGSIFKHIIALASKKYVVSRTIYDEEGKEYKVIGDAAGHNPSNSVKLQSVDSVKVEIVPGGVYSDIQFKQDMMELYQLQLADKESVLEAYKVGKTRIMLDRLEDEVLRTQGFNPAVEKIIKQADNDYDNLVAGKSVKVPKTKDRDVRNAYAIRFMQNAKSQEYTTEISERLQKYLLKMFKEFGINLPPELQPQEPQAPQQAGGAIEEQGLSSAEEKLINPTGVAQEEIQEVEARNAAISGELI